MSRRALALAVAALVLAAAGCGGGSSASAPAGAGVAPAASELFVSVDTSFDSGNWDAARALLAKFPDGDRGLGLLTEQLSNEDVDFDRDVKPALGPETDLVGLDVTGEGKFVLLTQPDDKAKLEALLAKGDETTVMRQMGDWTAVSDTEANLDEFERLRGEGTLDGVEAYRTVSDHVAEDALVHVYVSADALGPTPIPLAGLGPSATAISLDPEADGIHVEGASNPVNENLSSGEFEAQLPHEVPEGALVYVDVKNLEQQFSMLREVLAQAAPELEQQLGQAEAQLGVSLDEDIFPLFSDEAAFYVGPGFPIPNVTLVTNVEDENAAMASVDKLVTGLGKFMAGVQPVPTEIAGVRAQQVAVNQFFSIYYAAFDGRLVITTSRDGISALRSEDNRLADSESFKNAVEAAGMPDETSGFVYVDLATALPAILGFGGAGGAEVPSWLAANLEPLRSLVLWGGQDGDTATFVGVLSIQ